MDPDIEKHYQELLKEWKQDEDNIKDKLEKMEGKIPLKTVKTYNTNFYCSFVIGFFKWMKPFFTICPQIQSEMTYKRLRVR